MCRASVRGMPWAEKAEVKPLANLEGARAAICRLCHTETTRTDPSPPNPDRPVEVVDHRGMPSVQRSSSPAPTPALASSAVVHHQRSSDHHGLHRRGALPRRPCFILLNGCPGCEPTKIGSHWHAARGCQGCPMRSAEPASPPPCASTLPPARSTRPWLTLDTCPREENTGNPSLRRRRPSPNNFGSS